MSVLRYLERLAGDALHLPGEKKKVKDALGKLDRRLQQHFGDELEECFKFGSSVRGTNLPKEFANEMDIDYLVVFRNRDLQPRSMLRKVVDFAQRAYPRNEVCQSSPAVVVVLSAVRFELVPARRTLTGFFHSHQIPNGSATDWVGTNPRGFEEKLTERNKACHSRLKTAIRLVKMWNTANGYVFSSYRLENIAVLQDYPFDVSLKDYFVRLMRGLPEGELDAQWRVDRLRKGKATLARALQLEAKGHGTAAEKALDDLFGVQ